VVAAFIEFELRLVDSARLAAVNDGLSFSGVFVAGKYDHCDNEDWGCPARDVKARVAAFIDKDQHPADKRFAARPCQATAPGEFNSPPRARSHFSLGALREFSAASALSLSFLESGAIVADRMNIAFVLHGLVWNDRGEFDVN
jgi:hypothetical protein